MLLLQDHYAGDIKTLVLINKDNKIDYGPFSPSESSEQELIILVTNPPVASSPS